MHFPKHKLLYIHPPKTGGNAIQSALIHLSDDKKTKSGHKDGIDRFEISGAKTAHKHAALSDYKKSLGDALNEYQIIMSIRDPFERAVSLYFSPSRWHHKNKHDTYDLLTPNWDISKFRRSTRSMKSLCDFISVDSALIRPDHIIRFEHLANDFKRVYYTLRLQNLVTELSSRKINSTAAPSDLYGKVLNSKELRSWVYSIFKRDIEYFGL